MAEIVTTRTLSVMFIDMVGSTSLLDEVGDVAFTRVRHRYGEIVRRVVLKCHGQEIKSTGDGSLFVFESAAMAMIAAAEVQQSMAAARATGETQPLLKIGIALGDCKYESGDVFGMPVVVAARLCDRAEADEVLLGDTVALVGSPSCDIAIGDPVAFALKGIATPVSARALLWRSAHSLGFPLPAHTRLDHLFPFFGRHEQLDAVRAISAVPFRRTHSSRSHRRARRR